MNVSEWVAAKLQEAHNRAKIRMTIPKKYVIESYSDGLPDEVSHAIVFVATRDYERGNESFFRLSGDYDENDDPYRHFNENFYRKELGYSNRAIEDHKNDLKEVHDSYKIIYDYLKTTGIPEDEWDEITFICSW